MALFGGGADPRDELIRSQRDEIAWLRQRLEDRDKQVLALTDAAAYRMLHPYEAPKDETVRPTATNEPYRPALTLGEVKEQFNS